MPARRVQSSINESSTNKSSSHDSSTNEPSEKVVEYSMRAVSRLCGLSPDVIRAWEKRYGAVAPRRTATGRRVYGAHEMERLRLLRAATVQGHAIGRVANLQSSELKALLAPLSDAGPAQEGAAASRSYFADSYLEQCELAVRQLDASSLESSLARALVQFGPLTTIEAVVEPLLARIDALWSEGVLQVAEEHIASAVLHTFLSSLMRHVKAAPNAPTLVVTTPARQVHELGALMAAATAAHCHWNVLYLGANLPASEIAAAAARSNAGALALSLVYPGDDAALPGELQKLRKLLPMMTILVGGHAAPAYAATLKKIKAIHLEDLPALRKQLAERKQLAAMPGHAPAP